MMGIVGKLSSLIGQKIPLLPKAMLCLGKYQSPKLNPLPFALLNAIIQDAVYFVY